MQKLFVAFFLLCLLSGCKDYVSPKTASQPIPRFVMLQGQRVLPGGVTVPVVLRMDSTTGETWTLDGAPAKWVGVQDELRWAGKYDPKTKKLQWGVSLPDGRDLNELSREELARYLAAAVKSGASVDPNDPLGIRDSTKQK
jgi:hypothetical protein